MTTESNRVCELSFSTAHVRAMLLEDPLAYRVRKQTIVVNVGTINTAVLEQPRKTIAPLHSTILRDVVIERGDKLLLLTVPESSNCNGIVDEHGWKRYWDILCDSIGPQQAAASGFPKDCPLWRSPQDAVGIVMLDSYALSGQVSACAKKERLEIKVNLWFAPAGTDAVIHNRHDFIEVHTQVCGSGRMQKFRTAEPETLYEDIPMAPGYSTSDPFCMVDDNGAFVYPWHRYYADTDCIWLAVEYHRAR